MRTMRKKSTRLAALGAAALLGAGGLAAAPLLGATSAGATTVQQYFAFGAQGIVGAVATSADWSASAGPVVQGQNFTFTSAPSSQAIPTTNSGAVVNYIQNNVDYYPIPAGATYVSATAGGSVSFTPAGGGAPTTSPLVITYCATATSPGCTAQATSATFLGATPAPYLQVGTQPGTQFAAGGRSPSRR